MNIINKKNWKQYQNEIVWFGDYPDLNQNTGKFLYYIDNSDRPYIILMSHNYRAGSQCDEMTDSYKYISLKNNQGLRAKWGDDIGMFNNEPALSMSLDDRELKIHIEKYRLDNREVLDMKMAK